MSSADSLDIRPPRRPLRIAILIAAITCLGLTMCVRSDHKPPVKPAPAQAAPQAQPPPAQQQQQGDMSKQKPRYFNATKAPGFMY